MEKTKLYNQLNEQITFEIDSAYKYYAMAAYLRDENWNGFAHFMMMQAKEEMEHAERMVHFLEAVGHKVRYGALEEPVMEFDGVLDVFKKALEHEKLVTSRIESLVDVAHEVDDKKSISMLQWYIDEQVEEEDSFNSLIVRLERTEGGFAGLSILDQEMGSR